MSAPELKPFPFCGGDAGACPDPNHSTGWDVGCFSGTCDVEPHVWAVHRGTAEMQWQTRATQPAPRDEVIAELVEALDRVLAWHDKDKHTVGEMSFERSGAFSRARTALAAAKAVQP